MACVTITVANTRAGDQKPYDQSFSLFDAPLTDIIKKCNPSNPSMPNEDLSTIDEEKRSELLLVCESITFVVNTSNYECLTLVIVKHAGKCRVNCCVIS